ncbi:MAG TPA: OmpA family protein [Solimonas sp.]|nr:OmpA family protein [Solimonas sp.]
MNRIAILAGSALALAALPLQAQVEERYRLVSPSYIGVMGSYTIPGQDRPDNIDHALGFNVLFGVTNTRNIGYELGLYGDIFETGHSVPQDFYRLGGGLDLTWSPTDRRGFTPFLLVGGGGAYDDVLPDENDDWSWYLNGGVGFVTAPISDRGEVRVRGEARYVYDDHLDGNGDVRLSIGIEIPLFEEGVAPMPPPGEERVRVVELTTGLTDSDGDGVIDSSDRCPDTPPGTRVDGEGCTLSRIIELKGVTFEYDKARLRPDAETILDSAVAILKRYPDMNVEVAGHTDDHGSDDYNQKLSERRAAAVADYFRSHGIPAAQLTVKGYGEAEPVVSNDTDEGRERNRRVELRMLN